VDVRSKIRVGVQGYRGDKVRIAAKKSVSVDTGLVETISRGHDESLAVFCRDGVAMLYEARTGCGNGSWSVAFGDRDRKRWRWRR